MGNRGKRGNGYGLPEAEDARTAAGQPLDDCPAAVRRPTQELLEELVLDVEVEPPSSSSLVPA